MHDLSVVISVYNAASSIARTMDSVLAQTGPRFEVIAVDDGSTDDTPDLLARFAAADTRVRVVRQDNAGLTRSLMRACDLAQAPFIARQDAGDESLPGRFEQQLGALSTCAELSFVSCATEYVEPLGLHLYTNRGTGAARRPADIIDLAEPHGVTDGPSHHGSVMFRADAYRRAGGYRAEFHFGQDWDLWYRLAQQGKFQMLGNTLYRAEVDPGSISAGRRSAQQRLAALSLQALRARLSSASEAPILAEAARVTPESAGTADMFGGNYFVAECLRRNGSHLRAAHYLAQARRANPLSVKAWVRSLQNSLALIAHRTD